MATKNITPAINSDDLKRIENELEDLFETLRGQEEQIEKLYDLEAAVKVLATAVSTRVHDISDSNEELYRHAREIRVILKPETN